MKRTLIIDGDILVYQIAASCEAPYRDLMTPHLWIMVADLNEASRHVDSRIAALKSELEADAIVVCFSSPENFRKRLYPAYKMNRADTRKPMLIADLREYVESNYTSMSLKGLEGDDVMGILATHQSKIPGQKVMVSIDKDMKTIPGFHYRNAEQGIFEVSEDEADYWHMMQTLTGDATDGYPGCPGIGPKKAEKTLSEGVSWPAVVGCYQKAGLSASEAIIQARLARILRAEDYDWKTGKVRLWKPKPEAEAQGIAKECESMGEI